MGQLTGWKFKAEGELTRGLEATLTLPPALRRTSGLPTTAFCFSSLLQLLGGSKRPATGTERAACGGRVWEVRQVPWALTQTLVNGSCYQPALCQRASLTKGQLCPSWEPSRGSFRPQPVSPLVLMMRRGSHEDLPTTEKSY